jgi:Tol biopolymer transport system component/imidazolonepropionase-like amidohydrolase
MRLALALLVALVPAPALAKKPEESKKWDVQTAMPGKTVNFTVEEGTWLNLDVSPDGRTIVFDLLGDLYLMPIEGGKARRISGGPAWEVQPRFSPDGREIAFSSDRGGGHNLWRMPLEGGEPKAITKEDFRLYNNPVWTPDGDYLIGRKHFTGQRSLGAGELWLVHKTGGAGLQLTQQKNDQQDQGEPAVSPDGRYVYFSEDVTAGPTFQYNKNPHGTIYAIRRLDRQTGEIENLIQSPGGAVRPQPSPDGKQLAFVKRVREKTVLHVMDLATGIVRPVWDGLSHDQQEAWAIFGPYPNFDWLPDSSAVVIWAQGQFWRVAIEDGAATKIPFSAKVEQKLAPALRFERPLEGEDFAPKMIRDVATSPDGRTLVFHAVGKLWTKSLPNGKPRRLTTDETSFEYQPAFHPAGGKLLYTTWSDAGMGAVHELDLASGERRTLTQRKGYYYGPSYSPDGSRIVYIRSGGGSLTGGQHTRDAGIYVMPATGGEARRIARQAGSPQFSADGSRVYYLTGGGLSKKLMSVGLNGEEPREVFNLKYVNDVVISPDGRWVAFNELFNAYVAPMPQTGGVIELSKDVQGFPVAKVSADVGSYLHWSPDSRQLHWMVGREYHTLALNQAFAFLEGAPKELPKPGASKGIDIGLVVPTDQPQDVVAFVGARVITMRDAEQRQEVIEDGVVVVRGESIAAVGKRGEVAIPAGARIVDASGKTLMPGFVDVHAHAAHFGAGVVPQQNWAYYANLAYGITTMHDPSASTEFVFSQSELVKAGAMVGPRVTSTGTILYGADGDFKAVINSLDDARSHLKRMKANGAFSVKSYNQPRRDQRQQVNTAARELGMLVVEEGGSTFYHNLTMVLDGATGVEHNLPIAPLYEDVVGLWGRSEVRNVPTLVVVYGGTSGERWWYARDEVWKEERLNRFFPRETLDALSIRREIAPDWDYWHIEVAKAKKKLRDAGVRILVGGHGQMQGLAPHWEMWMFAQGGFTNFEVLRAATIDGADYIGFAKELGSLEAGKRADLVVLDGNPLEDIRQTASTALVMINGRLFDVKAEMAEIGGKQRPAPSFHWQLHRSAGQIYGIEYGPTGACHCPKSAHRH